nr:hypothetical protein [uncultured Flavobacterium sp.]
MKQYIFYILLLFIFGCAKNKSFNNKYFSLSVPAAFIIDSINIGEYSSTKFPGRELISAKDSESYIYSFYSDNKNSKERKGFTIPCTVMQNNLKVNYNEIILRELEKQKKYFSQNVNQNFEVLIPLKDTIVKNQKYSYYIYQYNNSDNKDVIKIKRARLFTKVNEKIHDIDLVFNSKDKSPVQIQFNELFSIVNTITFRK